MNRLSRTKAAALALLATLMTTAGIAVATTGSANAHAGGSNCLNSVQQYGDSGKCVELLQRSLNVCHAYGLKPDGIFGVRTGDALRAFQERHRMVQDKVAGPLVWRALTDCNGSLNLTGRALRTSPQEKAAPLVGVQKKSRYQLGECQSPAVWQKYGETSLCVRLLQQSLNICHGYGLGHDGVFGARTLDAVRDFQARHRIGVDGLAGLRTWANLDRCNGDLGTRL